MCIWFSPRNFQHQSRDPVYTRSIVKSQYTKHLEEALKHVRGGGGKMSEAPTNGKGYSRLWGFAILGPTFKEKVLD